jgi:hypothetical protein
MDVEYQLRAKQIERNVLKAELDEEELWECDKYQRLEKQISELQEHLNDNSEAPVE